MCVRLLMNLVNSQSYVLGQMIPQDHPRPKGNREKNDQQFLRSNSTIGNQTARTHARTNRNDFPVERPPTSAI